MTARSNNKPRAKRSPVEVLVRGEDSDGHLAVVELVIAAGSPGPPLHIHPAHGEGFYVLEGEVTIRVGDQVATAGPGTFAFAARDVVHTFANRSDRDARLLVLCAPAGFESYFDRLAADYARGVWPSPARPDPGLAIAVGPGIR